MESVTITLNPTRQVLLDALARCLEQATQEQYADEAYAADDLSTYRAAAFELENLIGSPDSITG